MSMLVTGLTVFVGVHLIPSVPPLRAALVSSLSEKTYRALFSVASAVGLVLIICGFSRAQFQPVYQPFTWGRSFALGLMPIALIIFVTSKMSTHIRSFVQHPTSVGLFLWAIAHLAANGDLSSILLFGTLGAYSVVATLSAVLRGSEPSEGKAPRWKLDAVAFIIGIAVAGLLVKFHGVLFGMPLI